MNQIKQFNRSIDKIYRVSSVLTLMLICFLVFMMLIDWSEEYLLMLASISTFFIMMLCTWRFSRKNGDYINPLTLILLSAFIGLFCRSIYIAFSDSPQVSHLLKGMSVFDVTAGSLSILYGYMFFFFGFIGRFGKVSLSRFSLINNFRVSNYKTQLVSVIVLFVSIFATFKLLTISSGNSVGLDTLLFEGLEQSKKRRLEVGSAEGLSGLSSLGYLRWMSSLIAPVFLMQLIFISHSVKKNIFNQLLLFLCFVFVFLFPLVASSRSLIQAFAIQIVIALYYTNRVKAKYIIFALAFVLVFFLASTYSREGGSSVGLSSFHIVNDLIVDPILGHHNYLGVAKTAHIVVGVPEEMDYLMGKSLISWVFAPIPRSLWEGKPVISIGYVLTEQLFSGTIISGGGTPPGIIAEMYLNFGFVGIGIGMYFFGIILGVLYRSFYPLLLTNPVALLIYISWVYELSIFIFGGDFSRSIISAMRGTITILVLLLLVRLKNKYQ